MQGPTKRSLVLATLASLSLASCARDLTLDLRASGIAAAGSGGANIAGTGSGGASAGAANAGGAGLSGAGNDNAGAAGDSGTPGMCLTCASCTMNSDCANAATQKICNTGMGPLAGLCVQCLSDSDCNAPRTCDLVTHNCVAKCTTSGDPACGNMGRACNPTLGYCVECLTNNECSGATPVCNHECVQCVDDSTCAGQHCWLQRHSCVDCRTDADCPEAAAPMCTGKHVCAAATTSP